MTPVEFAKEVVGPLAFERIGELLPQFAFRREGGRRWRAGVMAAPFGNGERTPSGHRGGVTVSAKFPLTVSSFAGQRCSVLSLVCGYGEDQPRGERFMEALRVVCDRLGIDWPYGKGAKGKAVDAVDAEADKRAIDTAMQRARLAREALERERAAVDAGRANEASKLFIAARVWHAEHGGEAIAWNYLTARGIPDEALRDTGGMPASIAGVGPGFRAVVKYYDERTQRWGEGEVRGPMLVCGARDALGVVTAVQRILLDPKDPTRKRPGERPKRGYGVLRGAAVDLGGGLIDPKTTRPEDVATVYLCEGVETGLMVRCATRCRVFACVSAGGLLGFTPPNEFDTCVIAGDFDEIARHGPARRPGSWYAARAAAGLAQRTAMRCGWCVPGHDTAPELVGVNGEIG